MSTALTTTAVLAREHHNAEAVVETMQSIADSLEQERRIDTSLVTEIIFFLRVFADQCQTAEEDALLFPALEAKCTSHDASVIASLRDEHGELLSLTLELAQLADEYSAGQDSARERLASMLRRLAALYREHIFKEDRILLPLAEKVLAPEELDALFQAFQRIESVINSDEIAKRIGRSAQRCECHMGEIFI